MDITKAKENFKRIGYTFVKKPKEFKAILDKYKITDQKNLGQIIKNLIHQFKTNDQFTSELSSLVIIAEKKPVANASEKKTSGADGIASTELLEAQKLAKELKESAGVIDPEEASLVASTGAKNAQDETGGKIGEKILIGALIISILLLIFFIVKPFIFKK